MLWSSKVASSDTGSSSGAVPLTVIVWEPGIASVGIVIMATNVPWSGVSNGPVSIGDGTVGTGFPSHNISIDDPGMKSDPWIITEPTPD
jgi:hypothetical protein